MGHRTLSLSTGGENRPDVGIALRARIDALRAECAFEAALELAQRLSVSQRLAAHADEIDMLIRLDDSVRSRRSLDVARSQARSGVERGQPELDTVELRHLFAFDTLANAERVVRSILSDETHPGFIEAWIGRARIARLRGEDIVTRLNRAANVRFEAIAPDVKLRLELARVSTCFRTVVDLTSAVQRLDHWSPEYLVEGARCAVAEGDIETASRIAAFAELINRRVRCSPSFATAAAQTLGLAADDITLLRQAVETARQSPRPLVLAHAALDYGTACFKRGASKAGTSALNEARELYTGIGASAFTLRVQRLLTRTGGRRRTWSLRAWSSRECAASPTK